MSRWRPPQPDLFITPPPYDLATPQRTIAVKLLKMLLAEVISDVEKLLAAICEGRVGAVLSIEASRLARNGTGLPPWLSDALCRLASGPSALYR